MSRALTFIAKRYILPLDMQDMDEIVDIFVVGGGINGTGIARDAAGRGLKVVLAEKDDLASHTSSASTKLIHGGLRYLEHYEFRLVRESLMERERLMNAAPHLIEPLKFVLPHHKTMRPAFILRLGLYLYDYIGGRKLLPATVTHNLKTHPVGVPLQDRFRKGFEYSDCKVDDARLVLHAAIDAAEHGATILTRTEVLRAARKKGVWEINMRQKDGSETLYRARALVNAAGPWVDHIEEQSHPAPNSKKKIRMVKGSHIIVPKIYEGEQAYTFQNDDNRVIFAIPYQEKFTLIGTTDVPFEEDANDVVIDDEESNYLCDVTSRYFNKSITADDIVWSYSGVRPLVEDGSENASNATRDYVLELDTKEDAPILSIYGGKITTFRRLAEDALKTLQPYLRYSENAWTENAPMPGGEMTSTGIAAFRRLSREKYPWLTEAHRQRLIRAYGSRIERILKGAKSLVDMGRHFGADLYEVELKHMRDNEWATTGEDALWRRSKLGLHLTDAECTDVTEWFESH